MQIIRTESVKFRGLAWYTYDNEFWKRARLKKQGSTGAGQHDMQLSVPWQIHRPSSGFMFYVRFSRPSCWRLSSFCPVAAGELTYTLVYTSYIKEWRLTLLGLTQVLRGIKRVQERARTTAHYYRYLVSLSRLFYGAARLGNALGGLYPTPFWFSTV